MPEVLPHPFWADGPRMAVWAYFPFDNRIVDPDTNPPTRADWTWAIKQWNRVAAAQSVVRLVVADQPYSRISTETADGQAKIEEMAAKFTACKSAGQLVFGRVYVAGGRLPLGSLGGVVDDPLSPGRQIPSVRDQLDGWQRCYGGVLDGIYLDSGPTACIDPGTPGAVPAIPDNYRSYAAMIEELGFEHFCISAPQYPDHPTAAHPGGWLRGLQPDFVGVWEGGMLPYRSRFAAKDPCRPGTSAGLPGWWAPGEELRWSRMHVITDCADAMRMRSIVDLAVGQRAAGTIWVTTSRQDPVHNAVFDVLPPYWAEEVAHFRPFVERDEAEKALTKETKEKETKEEKEKETKEEKEKETKEEKEKETKEEKEKEDKEEKEKEEKEDKETKEEEGPSEKELQDKVPKDEKDDLFPGGVEFLKDTEANFKTLEFVGANDVVAFFDDADQPEQPSDRAGEAEPSVAATFIRAEERPEVGDSIITDDDEYPDDEPDGTR